jgi:hypothetical protein
VSIFLLFYPRHTLLDPLLWTLVWQLRGHVIIRKAQKAIRAGDCRPRRRSSSRLPPLAPTRDAFESGASAIARVSDRGCLAEVIHFIEAAVNQGFPFVDL